MKKLSIKLITFIILAIAASCSSVKKKIPLEGVPSEKPVFTVLWSKNNDPAYKTGNLPIALSGPIVSEGLVYAGHSLGEMRPMMLRQAGMLGHEG